MNNAHSHAIGQIFPHKTKNTLTYIQRNKIKTATQEGDTASKIRWNEHLTCTKDTLYEAKRSTLKDLRENEMRDLIINLCEFQNWTNIVFIDETNKFRSCYCFHNIIMEWNYSTDICILDNTSCTNYYGKPLLTLLSEDENGKDQVLEFMVIENLFTNQNADNSTNELLIRC